MTKEELLKLLGDNEEAKTALDELLNGPAGEIERLQAKHKEAEKHRKEAEARVKEIEKAKAAEIEEARAKALEEAKKSGNIEVIEKSWQEKLAKREQELQAERDALSSEVDKYARVAEIEKRLDGKVTPAAKRWMMRDILEKTTLEKTDSGRHIRVLDDAGQPTATSLDEYVQKNIFDNTDYKPFIVGSKASGSGASGANGGGADLKKLPLSKFNELSHAERHAFKRDGGSITDD